MPRTSVETTETEKVPTLAGLTADQLRECLQLGATLAEVKELAESGFGHEAICSMASLLVKNRSSGGGNDEMLAILRQQADNQTVQNERTRPRENPNYKAVSYYLKPSGEPWAADLKCDMYFGPIHLNKTPMTQTEVEAWNRLQPMDAGTIRKNDGVAVRVKVAKKETIEGKIERLTVLAPMRKEDNAHLTYPSLEAIATQLADQAASA